MGNTARTWLTLAIAGLCLVLGGIAGWTLARLSGPAESQRHTLPVLGQAPGYHDLTNQLGESVSSSAFQGKVRIVTFLFPYCTTYCPLIAAHLVGLENLLDSAGLRDRVQIVAFDVDPAGTGPRQMRAFMKEFGWNPSDLHWQYLTGPPQVIRHIVTGGYHIAYDRTADTGDRQEQAPRQAPQPTVVNPLARQAHVDYDITHNDGLVIVDPRGRVRKIYDSADTISGQHLLQAVQRLLHGSGGT